MSLIWIVAEAAGIGVVTALVTAKVLRERSSFGRVSVPIAICVGAITFVAIRQMGGAILFFLIPWAALGVSVSALLAVKLARNLIGRYRETTPAGSLPVSRSTAPAMKVATRPSFYVPDPRLLDPPLGFLLKGSTEGIPNHVQERRQRRSRP